MFLIQLHILLVKKFSRQSKNFFGCIPRSGQHIFTTVQHRSKLRLK